MVGEDELVDEDELVKEVELVDEDVTEEEEGETPVKLLVKSLAAHRSTHLRKILQI